MNVVSGKIESQGPTIADLREIGLALHRLAPRSKKPARLDWPGAPLDDADVLEEHVKRGGNLGVILGERSEFCSCYWHVIDLDVRTPEAEAAALAALDEWLPESERTRCPTIRSGNELGLSRHYLIPLDRPLRKRKLAKDETKDKGQELDWQIELLGTGAQSVLPPSIHPDSEKHYTWEQEPDDLMGICGLTFKMPASRFEPVREPHELSEMHDGPVDWAEVERALDFLDPDMHRDDWVRIGMALHESSGGADDARELWHKWSSGATRKDKRGKPLYNQTNLNRQWKSFDRPLAGIVPVTVGTLFHMATQAGWRPSEREITADDFDDLEGEDATLTDPILEFNRRFAFLRINGKFRILDEGDGRPVLLEPATFHAQMASRRMRVGKTTRSVSKEWMESPLRRDFLGGMGFHPNGAPAGVYNTWRGWSAEPADEVEKLSASCDRFLAHLREIICAGDRKSYNYLIRWLAHLVQRPCDKPGVAVVLCSPREGVGKDVFGTYVGRLASAHYRSLTRTEDLSGRFNGLLDDALIVHAQELEWAGDPDARNRLYALVTSPTLTIERKGIDSEERPSFLRIIASSNASWVVPAGMDARRFLVLDVSDARRGDPKWFGPLHQEMNGLGPVALLAYLRSIDLDGFDVRKVPITQGLVRQKLASLRDVAQWWRTCIEMGAFPGGPHFEVEGWDDGWISVRTETLRESYAHWARGQNYRPRSLSPDQFGAEFAKFCPERVKCRAPKSRDGKRAPSYRIPSLAECRSAFDKLLGAATDPE
jgi:hypothetical protein